MTLAPLLDPPGRPLLLVSDFCYRWVWWLRVRPVWAALPGAARALSCFLLPLPLPSLTLFSRSCPVLYVLYRGGSWDAVVVLDSRERYAVVANLCYVMLCYACPTTTTVSLYMWYFNYSAKKKKNIT